MNQPPRDIEDGQTASGSVNTVKRVGSTVIRPAGAWSPSVHNLLNYLDYKAFSYSPSVIALDPNQNRETLSYIDGNVAMRPWPTCLLAESGIVEVAQMLLKYHQAVADYVPKSGKIWRVPDVQWKKGMIVRHGDLGPWNMVWKSEKLVGLIDWDFAEPGYPIEDVAQIAWDCVPLYSPKKSIHAGVRPEEQLPRLKMLCDSYGADMATVIDAVSDMQEKEFRRIKLFGKLGKAPWVMLFKMGGLDEIVEASQWLHSVYKPSVGKPLQSEAITEK